MLFDAKINIGMPGKSAELDQEPHSREMWREALVFKIKKYLEI